MEDLSGVDLGERRRQDQGQSLAILEVPAGVDSSECGQRVVGWQKQVCMWRGERGIGRMMTQQIRRLRLEPYSVLIADGGGRDK